MDGMSVPANIEVPENVDDGTRESIERVNRYLNWARKNMLRLNTEVKRLGNIRGDVPIHNGPGGIVILK